MQDANSGAAAVSSRVGIAEDMIYSMFGLVSAGWILRFWKCHGRQPPAAMGKNNNETFENLLCRVAGCYLVSSANFGAQTPKAELGF